MLGQLKISQHNVARGKDILQSFFEVSLKAEANLLLIQEPYTYVNAQDHSYGALSHPSFHAILPSPAKKLRPRVLAYIHKAFLFEITLRSDLISDPDMQIFDVTGPEECFQIIHIYNEKSTCHEQSTTTLERFFQAQLPVKKPFLLLGDLNLHHPWWNPLVRTPIAQAVELADYL